MLKLIRAGSLSGIVRQAAMRPPFILVLMVVTLGFFLVLMTSPGFWHRKAVDKAVVARFQNPTPENVEAVRLEQSKARRSQYIFCWLAVLNVMAIVVYGAMQQRKGMV